MSKALRTIFVAGSILLATAGSTSNGAHVAGGLPSHDVASAGTLLSVMTYNLEGLPWPIASGRQASLARIGERLAALRQAGRQPHIVLLQEAFTTEAQAIAQHAGYRHVAFGPDAAAPRTAASSTADRAFVAGARLDRGELAGKWFGSGLIILSDYPIRRIDRLAYPDHACAGFDCLANKGAVIAHLQVPGFAAPVAVVDTHLNARKAAGVSIARSQQAFARQADLLARFVADHVAPGQALMFGGDMNIGSDASRAAAFFGAFDRAGLDFVAPGSSGIHAALGQRRVRDPRSMRDLTSAAGRRKDWVFARGEAGARQALAVTQAHVPFGSEPDGTALSDHFGYVIDYAAPGAGPVRATAVALASNDIRPPVGGRR